VSTVLFIVGKRCPRAAPQWGATAVSELRSHRSTKAIFLLRTLTNEKLNILLGHGTAPWLRARVQDSLGENSRAYTGDTYRSRLKTVIESTGSGI
jgi:hypothetical protein